MQSHLKSHGITLSKAQQAEYTQCLEEFSVSTSMDIQVPLPHGPPVECLNVIEEGYCCNHCDYCIPTRRTFNNHWSGVLHQSNKSPAEDAFHRGCIQTFFHGNKQQWFEVLPGLVDISPEDPFGVYLRQQVPQFISTLNPLPVHVREIPPLLQITGWHSHLEHFIQTKKDVRGIRSLVRLPPFREKKGLGRLRDVVEKYMRDTRLKATQSALGVRCLLMECPR
jgi:hypothetical protein